MSQSFSGLGPASASSRTLADSVGSAGVRPDRPAPRGSSAENFDGKDTTPIFIDVADAGPVGRASDPRDRMIAIFGHDLRGLLNALTVNAEVLLGRRDAAGEDDARPVRLAIRRMDQLIGSLLEFTRLSAGRLEVHRRPFDAGALLREVVDIFRPLAGSKPVALTLTVPDTPLTVSADSERMFQVFSNLLSNAIAFSSDGGRISVEASSSGADVQIAVADSGPGIPAADRDRVFEAFQWLPTAGAHGLGLGLYIARAIVDAHGGKLWVTSEPGVGSTFYVRIPAAPRERSAAPTTAEGSHPV